MLNRKVITQSLSSFSAITFTLCVGYGLLVPSAFHAAWLLEAMLPGFKWLSVGSSRSVWSRLLSTVPGRDSSIRRSTTSFSGALSATPSTSSPPCGPPEVTDPGS